MKKRYLLLALIYCSIHAAPPRLVPDHLHADFSMNGKVIIESYYFDGTVSAEKPIVYTKEKIASTIEQVKQGRSFHYEITDIWLYQALKQYPIENQTVVIFGSVDPVYESICLAYGATPITIEYNKWQTDHPLLRCMTPDEYDQDPILFDAGISISSFEHDGLGRYGDPINPWADLQMMKKVKKMIKPNGLLFLAVPVGRDFLYWNAHRIYGTIRLPLLIEGWEVVGCYGIEGLNDPKLTRFSNGGLQPVLVLRNTP